MTDRIRVGIVGASVTPSGSRWGANVHIPALKSLPEFELKAVCTAHAETARASAAAFGAELAFSDFDEMVARPEIDLIVVCVRVPSHYPLVMAALEAGKAVFCEWPLAANLREAEEMAGTARAKGLRTAVGLQGRSIPALHYARDLLADGYIGRLLAADLVGTRTSITERPPDRIWQAARAAGANTLTIDGGHEIDMLCFLLGEFTEVSARVGTLIKHWRNTADGSLVSVDAPDHVTAVGLLASSVEASVRVATYPHGAGGMRIQVFGTEGSLVIDAPGNQTGPVQLFAIRGQAAPEPLDVPERYRLLDEGGPAGQALNVARAYARLADVFDRPDERFDPDFEVALQRHRMLDAFERSSAEGRSVELPV